jgi:hypothetical protein
MFSCQYQWLLSSVLHTPLFFIITYCKPQPSLIFAKEYGIGFSGNNMEYEIYSLFVNIHISYRVPIVFDKNVFLNIRHVLQIKIDKTCSK